MAESPITVTELLQLTQLRIPLEHITWPRVSMTSDQWICIRHGKQNGRPTKRIRSTYVTILNPCRADFPQVWQIMWQHSAGSVMMNPEKPLMAVKDGMEFLVYNLDSRRTVFRTTLTVRVVFWRWINSSVIAMVTDASVYHWDLAKEKSQPRFMFARHARLDNADIVNYVSDSGMKWFALVGLAIEEDRICGVTQIYSVEHDLSQPIEAHAVTFCSYVLPDNKYPSTLLIAVGREAGNSGKIHAIELGPHVPGNQAPTRHIGDLLFEDDWEKYDFPVSVQVSVLMGLVFIITKYGQLHLCDLETGQLLSSTRICADILFVAALCADGRNVLTISRNGQVLLIGVKAGHISRYVRESLQRPLIADRLEKVMTELHQMSLLTA